MPANAFSGTLTVNVSDALPKTLSYKPVDGELEINAFSVSIANSSGTELKNNADSPIALSGGSGAFVITGLTTGTYTVTVTGYLNDNGTYHDIATGTAKDIHLTPSSPDTVSVVIDTFVDEPVSSVTVDVEMPTDVLVNGSVEGTMTYSLTDPKTGEVVVSERSVSVTGVVDGVYTLTIPESVAPGRYVLLLGFTATGDDSTYRGAEAMLVYPGLPVTGTVSLDSQHAFEAGFTVTDKIGSELVYDYEEDALVSEDGSFTVTLDRALPEGTSVSWYVDGVETTADVSGRAYTFTGLSTGKRSVVAIFWDETAAGVGTLAVDVVVKGEMGIEKIPIPENLLKDITVITDSAAITPEQDFSKSYILAGPDGNVVGGYETYLSEPEVWDFSTADTWQLVNVFPDTEGLVFWSMAYASDGLCGYFRVPEGLNHKLYLGFDYEANGTFDYALSAIILYKNQSVIQSEKMPAIAYSPNSDNSRFSSIIQIDEDIDMFSPFYFYVGNEDNNTGGFPTSFYANHPILVDITANQEYFTSIGLTTDEEIQDYLDSIPYEDFASMSV